jgi:hypothetical protein
MRWLYALLFALAGCSRFQSVQETADGTRTTVTVTTFLNAQSGLSKLRTTQTEKTQGVGLGSLESTASFTNTIHIVLPRP